MKFGLGISYNIFDGEELLETSLKSVRGVADHISVVYQTTSNFGVQNKHLLPFLEELKAKGFIDKLFEFKPELTKNKDGSINWKSGSINELEKRQIGLQIAKANGMQYYMTMDADEVYDTKELVDAIANFQIGDYDSSFCKMKSFYKKPTLEIKPAFDYYVPLFFKIKKESKMGITTKGEYPVKCDPTRRMIAGHTRVFTRNEIEMYHYSYLRKDIESKIFNSSAQSDIQSKKIVIDHYNNWDNIKDGAKLIGNFDFKLEEVENKFNIKL